jgi:AraC-like DNA-binding protein
VLNETNRKLPFFTEHLSGDVQVLIINLARAIYKSENHSQREEKLERVLDYIRDNYKNDISNQTLAEIAGYHPYHLNRIFKEYTDKSIHAFILNYRLSVACLLLRSEDMSVNMIAELVGYTDTIQFYKMFKKHIGVTPKQFRINVPYENS